MYAVFKDIVFN